LPRLAPLRVESAVELELPGLPADARPHGQGEGLVPVTWMEAEVEERPSRWDVVDDPARAGVEAEDWTAFTFPDEGLRCEEGHVYSTSVAADDPLSARVEGRTRFAVDRRGLDCVTEARGTVTCTEHEFLVDLELAVTRGGEPFHARRWRERIPRRGC
jgi:hypothetical protein